MTTMVTILNQNGQKNSQINTENKVA